MPLHVVDAHSQRALHAGEGRRGDKGERRLLQRELLQGLAASPLPRLSLRVSPWVALTTLP